FILLVCSIFTFNTTAFAYQEPIYVKINGTLLEYKDATPQITNQRAMVPIRATAEALGATIEWNKTTETMTILKGNRVSVHKMRSNVITVNGVAKTFDTPSINVKDRTLMPVIMLSEAIGNNVTWDNATRTVNIIADGAYIKNVQADKSTVQSGERVVLTILASSGTEKVKIVDINDGALISENTTYTTNSDGTKTFSVPWTPSVTKNTYKSLKIVGGTLTSYNESNNAYKVCPITITTEGKGRITEVTSNKTEIGRGDEIKLTIKADSSTQKVKIVDDSNSNLKEIVNYKIENGLNIFESTMSFNSRGDITLKVYPGNASGYSSTYETIKINVGGAGSSDTAKKNAKLTFHDMTIVNNINYVGENTQLKLYTSSDIVKVEVLDENSKSVDKVFSPVAKDDENNEYTWSLLLPIYKEGRNLFKIIGYNKDDEVVTENLSIVGNSYNKNDLCIISVTQRDTEAIVGDTVKFTVKTTRVADKLKVLEGDREVQTITNYSTEGDYKIWEFRIKITDSNRDRLSVVAYDGNATDSAKLSTYISEAVKAKIYDIQIHTPEVALNEYIRITVYTNKPVSKVWVEDQSGYKVTSTKTTYDRKSGEEYEWDLRVPADEVGERVTFNVYAQDGNGTKVDDYFR
ncbi:MAG: copper amine oxidase N-terminal domain-containing protein, partial [Eubacteriales bacterium]|nr:copper amine oxidase N-terminal domain-containing protein [Eubacteriales bacterium]